MSERIKQLAEGNFVILFLSDHSSHLAEALCRVTKRQQLDEAVVLNLEGFKITYATPERYATTIGTNTKDPPAFSPISDAEARQWLARNSIVKKITDGVAQAERALQAMQEKRDKLNAMFDHNPQGVLEGAAT